MKKTLLFTLLLTLFVGFSSCSNDDDENEPFKWEGDIEGYNPLQGLWKYENTPTAGLKFSEDKILYRITFTSSGDEVLEVGPFEINKKAYKTGATGITRYKLDEDRLTRYPNQNNDNEASVLIKVR
jgi:hypothetical protein